MILKNWGSIGELTKDQQNQLIGVLYTYQDLNSIELGNLPFTDLHVHRARSKEGTPPFSRLRQQRWPPGKEFCMKRIVKNSLRCGLYKPTIKTNGCLLDWNVMVQLVDKSDNPGEWNEPRLRFNFQNLEEGKTD